MSYASTGRAVPSNVYVRKYFHMCGMELSRWRQVRSNRVLLQSGSMRHTTRTSSSLDSLHNCWWKQLEDISGRWFLSKDLTWSWVLQWALKRERSAVWHSTAFAFCTHCGNICLRGLHKGCVKSSITLHFSVENYKPTTLHFSFEIYKYQRLLMMIPLERNIF